MSPDLSQSQDGTAPSPDMESLRNRYEALRTKRITLEANLKTSQQTLDGLKRQANEKYGTDDVASLRAKLEEMKQDNERKLQAYHEHLTGIEHQLAEIETRAEGVIGEESVA